MDIIEEQIKELLENNVNFSDILAKTGDPLRYRVPAGVSILRASDILDDEDISRFIMDHTENSTGNTPDINKISEMMEDNGGHLDLSMEFCGYRFRCNIFWFGGKRSLGISLRKLNNKIPTFEFLKAPPSIIDFAKRSSGLVLVTGPTGSGKTSTLAALINYINENYSHHIITLEDPIEYMHKDIKSSITQREVRLDCDSFFKGLEGSLREDPDVILVGEIRDRQTAEAALMGAETGHLVFSTLHTTSAAKTIERVMDFFDGSEKELMRSLMASTLAGVISQTLVSNVERDDRVLVCEILKNTDSISNMIRNGKLEQINNEIIQGAEHGMQLLNNEFARLVANGVIDVETALHSTYDQFGLEKKIHGG